MYMKQHEIDKPIVKSHQISFLSESTEIEYCLARGTDVDGYLNMCTTCAASTTLAEDKFPRMLNEVICDQKDQGCFTVNGTRE